MLLHNLNQTGFAINDILIRTNIPYSSDGGNPLVWVHKGQHPDQETLLLNQSDPGSDALRMRTMELTN